MAPRVSVVIPTHARETRLAFALDSLAEQTASPDKFEVIVVRSPGAPPPYAEAPNGIAVTFLTSPREGPPAKRNVGWRAASAPLVAFMDDDCRAAPEWIEEVVASARARSGGESFVIQGRTEPDPDELHLLYGLARTVDIQEPSGLFETCNLAYPVELLEELGGFDESFLRTWGEDTDLGLRGEESGAELAWAQDAVVWHAVHPQPLWSALGDAERRRDQAALIARHPRLRRLMPGRVFVNVAHRDVAFGLACLPVALLAPRWRKAVAAIAPAPYLLRVTVEFVQAGQGKNWRRVARFGGHLPSRVLVDLAETLWTVRGAIEHRTPIV